MKERLTNNLGLKIISVVLAIFTWLIMVNVSNPLIQDTREVPVEVLNESVLESANLTYELVGKKTVTVSYEVRTRDRYKIASSDFYATADLAELYDVTGAIPVTVEVSNREVRSLVQGTPSAKPGVVRIQTEPLQRKKFILEAHVTGEPESGFAPGPVTVNPEYIFATGAESDIGKINALGIEVNLEGANSDRTGAAQVRFYDSNGNELKLADQVDLSLESVNYYATILQLKNVPLEFQVSGEAAEGYRYVGAEADIQSVELKGLKSTMDSVNQLTVPKELLNIDGAKGDVIVTVDLSQVLPSGVTAVNSGALTVQVTLKVERLVDREIDCSLENLILEGEREEYTYTMGAEYVTLTIRGLDEELDTFDETDVKLTADVSDLEPGLQPISIEAELSDGFELMGHGPMMIYVKNAQETADSDSQETEGASGTGTTADS